MKIMRIKEVMTDKGITGKALAGLVGVTEVSISNLSKGESIPRKDVLIKIANVLDVDIRDLFESTKGNRNINERLSAIINEISDIQNELKH